MNGVVLGQRTYFFYVTAPVKTPVPDEYQLHRLPTPPTAVNTTWNWISGSSRYVLHIFPQYITGVHISTSLVFDSLEKTIKPPYSYWSADWD